MTRVALSTVSVYPETTSHAFTYADSLGFDGVEVMVGIDAISQDVASVRRLSRRSRMPVLAVHAPCLLFTQRVWGTEPWGKLQRAAHMAEALECPVVVVHPPFRWQGQYADGFADGIAALEESTGVALAVENMYPWRTRGAAGMAIYRPGWDPSREDFAHATIDLSHAAIAGDDVVAMADRLGTRLRHVHLTDGSGSPKDEHLVPGRGAMAADRFLGHLAASGYRGDLAVEINTRRSRTQTARRADLADSLAFARTHFRW